MAPFRDRRRGVRNRAGTGFVETKTSAAARRDPTTAPPLPRPARQTSAPARQRADRPAPLPGERAAAPGHSPPGVAAGGGPAALSPPGLVLNALRPAGAAAGREPPRPPEPGHRSSPDPPGLAAAPLGPSPPPSAAAAGARPGRLCAAPRARGGGAGGGGVWPPRYPLGGRHLLPAAGPAARCLLAPRGSSRELGVRSPENPASPARRPSSAFDGIRGENALHADNVELEPEPRDSGERRLKTSLHLAVFLKGLTAGSHLPRVIRR